MANLKEIAKIANVSVSTVSKALSEATDISDETRKLVEEAAERLGYSKKRHKGKICVFIKNMCFENEKHFGYDILTGFKKSASAAGYDIVITLGDDMDSESDYENFIKNKFTGGFLLGLNLADKHIKQLENVTTPTVLLDNVVRNPIVGSVGCDSHEGISLAVHEMISKGHTNIALFNGDDNSYVSMQRSIAFRCVMRSLGLEVTDDMIVHGSYTEDTAPKFVPELLAKDVTGIICASDVIASYAIKELARLGKAVPNDISVMGFDNLQIAQFTNPPLTTIEQNRYDIGKSAFLLLRALMNGMTISKLLTRPKLIKRDSVKDIRQ